MSSACRSATEDASAAPPSMLIATLLSIALIDPPRFWGELRPGVHEVGFQTFAAESSPGSAGWKPRPIEVSVWYPAQKGNARRMTFGEYFQQAEDLRRRSAASEIDRNDLKKTLSIAISGDSAAIPPETAQTILDSTMFARRDAPPANGRFPLVMWSARYGTTAAQSVMSEFLASHGYVVAAVRPAAASEKLPFELKTAQSKVDELEAQSDDLRGAIRKVRALTFTDPGRSALIAWSYAGESAWWIAQGDARIDLIIGLDTNVRANWVYQSEESLAAIDSGPRVAEVVAFDRKTPGFDSLSHGNYNALEGMIPAVMGIERVQKWSSSGPAAKRGYETLSRRVAERLGLAFKEPQRTFERVEIAAANNAMVTAEVHRHARPSGRCAALFHQSGASRGEYRTIGPELAHMGYTALAVDVRGGRVDRWNDVTNETAARHGTPAAVERGDRERVAQIRADEPHDLDAAIDWLRAHGCTQKILVWGSSIQANGVFELALRRPDHVGAIVDVSPGEYSEDEPDRMKTLVASVKQPSLVIWGRNELELSKPIFDALPAGNKHWYQSPSRHGNAVFFEDPIAWKRLREFLAALETAAP